MKLIRNTGNDRVIDELRRTLAPPSSLDLASPAFSLFAFAELREVLEKLDTCRVVLPEVNGADLGLTGSDNDRAFRNRLQVRWLARECAAWIKRKVELRTAPASLPQSILIAGTPESELHRVITGNCAFTTEGLGLTPGNQFSLIQCSERPEESAVLGSWFASLWNTLPASDQHKAAFLARLQGLVHPRAASLIYYLTLSHVFKELGDELDEERIVKSATGIRNTTVWKKLYKFQRDGVVGAIDKLERLGGCIIADSVGLGKTFEGLAIIKYYELRNDRVLVLVPKRHLPPGRLLAAVQAPRTGIVQGRMGAATPLTPLGRRQGASHSRGNAPRGGLARPGHGQLRFAIQRCCSDSAQGHPSG